jgi:8-oxo-dGTP pyrophosphatase MutT (NUDIX family)
MAGVMHFADKLKTGLKSLPGPQAQEKMAPEHRLPHQQWERYYKGARLGGILILFYPIGSRFHTVMIQRPTYEGVHSGQIGFPGGQKEDSDSNLIFTALREANEEVGIVPETLEVLGTLSQLYIPPSNFLITPVVAFSGSRPSFMIDAKEVVEIIEPETAELLDEKSIGLKSITVKEGISIKAPYYDIRGKTVWGATAMVISELNEVLRRI